jgi:hypothetical protein
MKIISIILCILTIMIYLVLKFLEKIFSLEIEGEELK